MLKLRESKQGFVSDNLACYEKVFKEKSNNIKDLDQLFDTEE
jgi:hypothetical protein